MFLLLLLSMSFMINNEKIHQTQSFLWDDERLEAIIQIESDNDFTILGLNGTGTESDPYIIEDIVIETQDKGGIYISDTSKSCKIRNCTILSKQFGIYIEDLIDGKFIIEDNYLNVTIINRDGYGIFLMDFNEAEIKSNVCTGTDEGISLNFAKNLIVQENNCSYNSGTGINLDYVEYSTIENNFCINNTFGITTFSCSSLNITNNVCSYNGFSDPEGLEGSLDLGEGIRIGFSHYCRVINNNCSKNLIGGLSYYGGDFFIAYNNTFKSNRIGIQMWIERSGHLVTEIVSGVALVYNKLVNNSEYGIWLSGYVRQSYIHHNIFIHNNIEGTSIGHSQAREDTRKRNTWYDEQSNVGNYWSDYQNEGIYQINGNGYISSNNDPYPIANLSEMNIPLMPEFPKGKWFSDRDFVIVRIISIISGIIIILLSLLLIPTLIIVSRKRKIEPKIS